MNKHLPPVDTLKLQNVESQHSVMVIHLSIHIEASQLRVMLLNIEVISQQIVNKTQQNKTVPYCLNGKISVQFLYPQV